jgi:hypothetical protein
MWTRDRNSLRTHFTSPVLFLNSLFFSCSLHNSWVCRVDCSSTMRISRGLAVCRCVSVHVPISPVLPSAIIQLITKEKKGLTSTYCSHFTRAYRSQRSKRSKIILKSLLFRAKKGIPLLQSDRRKATFVYSVALQSIVLSPAARP